LEKIKEGLKYFKKAAFYGNDKSIKIKGQNIFLYNNKYLFFIIAHCLFNESYFMFFRQYSLLISLF
jgi:hypothetical protein